ncbi:imidazole glycerol phosphate synthase subunit HisH [Bacillus carboniphilus]|uniref:Imidazole glycerol phosphate synthase subunit HisH n=1 Tax=Bacillus carboniphilus TaxID=86663 RepID=A0ABY9JPV5_9BACI|nr:imidazole glycerol phosphate synthase subunit HisH [Bacillus carboniphilus]WLR41439.1 imidazole glycerol phosphate synthase subunit HisH [Bacillus carboniphilus]
MIGIIDYGMGNLFSVSKALERQRVPYFISNQIEELKKADAYILPGVGSFKDSMDHLNKTGLTSFIQELQKPLLGICLGMQLLFEESEEGGKIEGLKLLPGKVEKIPRHDGLKVPHMGWNELEVSEGLNLEDDYVYFVHSYYVKTDDPDVVLAKVNYGVDIPAIVGKGSVFGTQFHPEKSSRYGEKILDWFLSLTDEKRGIEDEFCDVSSH